jgi:hypothetical protein
MCGQESREPWELHKSSFFWGVGSWAGCVLASKAIELDRERFAARPSPRLCEIWNASSISSFEHESEKKGPSSQRPLSFHQQPWLRIREILVRIWIHGSIPLTYGSGFGSRSDSKSSFGSWYFFQWPSSWQLKSSVPYGKASFRTRIDLWFNADPGPAYLFSNHICHQKPNPSRETVPLKE